ncbi:transcription antitermination factor NusB [Roseburia intestinalis]|jgi:transcription antitermination factor NusB|uniref:Transcription antitermination protein NusB n=4 Tax=Roseburia intestinalis TaxID=166486 RepID=A0A3R6EKN4_9FIRM|nr:transcription antitermination factor NusB [Roseburia intestinalis]MBD9183363.1 transcription antitermination factor NusB [Roseburia intestinalis]MTR83966.1 transcription antitermination factor NusB [Roseburia intestinalis]MVQ44711.1 transcription antitermination factor NusB [Roseburia intestinalis]NSC32689.1 transcription antitermination factor NusB [Roseburia intestinalis]RHA68348.1 transcription antitermination factor NusB [Roseburia intestinalis]
MTEEKNMTRREIREQVFKMLFRVEFYNQEEMSEQIALCEDDACSWKEKDKTYIFEKVEKISEKLEEIDAKINEVSEGWKTGRMGKVDLTLIRLAVYEMLYEEDVPAKVAINEAVELAKQYGTDNSPSFVNGVLAKLV